MLNAHRYNEKTSSIERIDFTVLGNKEIKNMSCLGKDTPGLLVYEFYDNTEPKKGGLIDQRMGVTSNELECTTCGLSTNYCPGHFGHITLSEPVFNLGFFEHVISVLKCVCIKCSKLLVYKNESEIMEILKTKKGKNRLNEIRNIVKNVTYCQKANYKFFHYLSLNLNLNLLSKKPSFRLGRNAISLRSNRFFFHKQTRLFSFSNKLQITQCVK